MGGQSILESRFFFKMYLSKFKTIFAFWLMNVASGFASYDLAPQKRFFAGSHVMNADDAAQLYAKRGGNGMSDAVFDAVFGSDFEKRGDADYDKIRQWLQMD